MLGSRAGSQQSRQPGGADLTATRIFRKLPRKLQHLYRGLTVRYSSVDDTPT
jgi:hypothetical protein